MNNEVCKFEVGQIVRIVTGPGHGHLLKKNAIVKIIRISDMTAFIVQAPDVGSFRTGSGWSRDRFGDHLQHVSSDDVEPFYAGQPLQKALSKNFLPLI